MKILLCAQGLYYLITGIWPLLHIKSFFKVTGPKKEVWLVRTFGLLIAVIAVVLLSAANITEPGSPVIMLAMLTAAALIVAETYYVINRTIPSVYMLDAAAELIFLAGWLIVVLS